MNKENKILIMFVGKTHTGKTTLAQKIKNKIQDLLVLEADPIAIFMKEKFPELRSADDTEHSGFFNNISLKYRTFLLFLEFSLSLGRPIILSNSNMWLKGRELVIELCKKFDYKVIGVYLDFPEELLFERAKVSDRPLNILRVSKDFDDLIINQRTRMQPPDPKEFDEFLTIKSEEEVDSLEIKILTLLK